MRTCPKSEGCSTQGSKPKAMLFGTRDHIQVQIILGTVPLCHISSKRMKTVFCKTQTYVANRGGVHYKSKIWLTRLTPTAIQSAS